MAQDLTFAQLIGSRICHDLISPIGAINNGLELLQMSGPSSAAEMALIGESVSNASARIRFFRIAFGAAGTQMVGRAEVTSILQDVYSGSRLTVVWGPLDAKERSVVRMVFLALLCFETAMPYGGRIEIDQDLGKMVLTGYADKLKLDTALWACLDGTQPDEDLRAAHVQFGLLPVIAQDEKRPVSYSSTDDRLTLTV